MCDLFYLVRSDKILKLIRKSQSTGISQHINNCSVLTGVAYDDSWHLCCLFLMMPTFCKTTVQKDEWEVTRFLTQKASNSISFCLHTHTNTHTTRLQCWNWAAEERRQTPREHPAVIKSVTTELMWSSAEHLTEQDPFRLTQSIYIHVLVPENMQILTVLTE